MKSRTDCTLAVGEGRSFPERRRSGGCRAGGGKPRPYILIGALALVLTACRQDMHDQPKYEPLEASEIFADGAASRTPPEGTVARGHLGEDTGYQTGVDDSGAFVPDFPMAVDMALLERGRSRYDAFCSPCHDRLGNGRGMVVRRGYKQPNSLHDQRLVDAQPGYFVNVITNGFGQMSSYAPQLRPADRWAVAAYIRALQLSRRVPAGLLTDEERGRLAEPAPAAETPVESHDGGHS